MRSFSRSIRRVSTAAKVADLAIARYGLPAFDAVGPSEVKPAVDALVADASKNLDALIASLPGREPCVDDLLKLEALGDDLERAWGIVGHLMGVANSPEWRAAYNDILPAVHEFSTRVKQEPELFRLHKALADAKAGCDPAVTRAAEVAALSSRLAGVELEPAAREEFNKLLLETTSLSQTFSNNVIDATGAYALRLTSAEEVDGLPQSVKALLASNARSKGDADATAEAGPWSVGLDQSSFRAFMTNSTRRDLREALYRAYITRASSEPHNNVPLIAQILTKRQRMAELLGYADHAAVSTAAKMAGTPEAAFSLLAAVRERAYPAAKADMERLQAFAEGKGFTGPLKQWDVPFYRERMLEETCGLNEEEVKAYFPLDAVMAELMRTAGALYGVTFKQRPASDMPPVWHPDVQFFDIYSAPAGAAEGSPHTQHIASFFLDPYARPATKKGGAWMDVCLGRTTNPALLADGEEVRLPVAYLVCNQAPPVDGKPSLMRHSDVVTLFHEMGHGLQHMLTRVGLGPVAGISGIEWDAVELPSQMMEEFCYSAPILKRMTRHVDTGAPIPDELVEKLRSARHFFAAVDTLRQAGLSMTDLSLHSEGKVSPFRGADGSFDPFAVERSVAATHSLLTPLPEDRFLCSFSHIFAGGYSAGYFSYLWAAVMSADAFNAFEEAHPSADATQHPEVAAVGRRFRETVLALGGSVHPAEVFRSFRGRDPSIEPLMKQMGL